MSDKNNVNGYFCWMFLLDLYAYNGKAESNVWQIIKKKHSFYILPAFSTTTEHFKT